MKRSGALFAVLFSFVAQGSSLAHDTSAKEQALRKCFGYLTDLYGPSDKWGDVESGKVSGEAFEKLLIREWQTLERAKPRVLRNERLLHAVPSRRDGPYESTLDMPMSPEDQEHAILPTLYRLFASPITEESARRIEQGLYPSVCETNPLACAVGLPPRDPEKTSFRKLSMNKSERELNQPDFRARVIASFYKKNFIGRKNPERIFEERLRRMAANRCVGALNSTGNSNFKELHAQIIKTVRFKSPEEASVAPVQEKKTEVEGQGTDGK